MSIWGTHGQEQDPQKQIEGSEWVGVMDKRRKREERGGENDDDGGMMQF